MPMHPSITRPSPLLLRWFTWYSRRYFKQHFHALRIANSGLPPKAPNQPIVIFSNHPGWWDPLIGLILKDRYYPDRNLHAPIDAIALQKYPLLRKLGFFPVLQSDPKDARRFLRTTQTLLQNPDTLLVLTPQGRFTDTRQRPITFQRGISHLPSLAPHALFVPCALEYTYWNQRLPEALVLFGPPLEIAADTQAKSLHLKLQSALQSAQDALAPLAINRDPSPFQTLLSGASGQGGIYDLYRALTAKLTGKTFNPEHS